MRCYANNDVVIDHYLRVWLTPLSLKREDTEPCEISGMVMFLVTLCILLFHGIIFTNMIFYGIHIYKYSSFCYFLFYDFFLLFFDVTYFKLLLQYVVFFEMCLKLAAQV